MKFYQILTVAAIALFTAVSCDKIDFEDRFDGPVAVESGKNILIEDYTGQKCSNCPLAHAEIKALQKAYGSSRVIAVALHGGPQAVDEGNPNLIGLANEESREYNRRLGKFSYPKGVVDRKSGLLDFEKWNAFAVSRFSAAPKVKLQLNDISADTESRKITFKCSVEGIEAVKGNLQLWLTESNIVAVQIMPAVWGGGHKADYVHNHVFRAAVNGLDGEPIEIAASQNVSGEYSCSLKDGWNPQNMSLVAFFYNETDGVMQVTDAPVIENNLQISNKIK